MKGLGSRLTVPGNGDAAQRRGEGVDFQGNYCIGHLLVSIAFLPLGQLSPGFLPRLERPAHSDDVSGGRLRTYVPPGPTSHNLPPTCHRSTSLSASFNNVSCSVLSHAGTSWRQIRI